MMTVTDFSKALSNFSSIFKIPFSFIFITPTPLHGDKLNAKIAKPF
jgi:hypothetical protein